MPRPTREWSAIARELLNSVAKSLQGQIVIPQRKDTIRRLQKAFDSGDLTLLLGAGCSVASGVPTWGRLVTQLYINGIARRLPRFRQIPGLIPAVGAWAFAKEVVPFEVGARRLRGFYRNDEDLLLLMGQMLYGLTGFYGRGRLRPAEIRRLVAANRTLRAVSQLCRRSLPEKRGVRAVITYNYDDFLEKALGHFPHQSAWRAMHVKPGRLPIYHVHGFVPARTNRGSTMEEIVLTEEQYNRAAQDPYSWANLVQLHALSGSVALMVGLSLSDRNLRRILDSLRGLPRRVECFALLCRAEPWKAQGADIESILEEMKTRIRQGFEFGYDAESIAALEKTDTRPKILKMIRQLHALDSQRGEATLQDLGVQPIWYEHHEEVEHLIERISRTTKTR